MPSGWYLATRPHVPHVHTREKKEKKEKKKKTVTPHVNSDESEKRPTHSVQHRDWSERRVLSAHDRQVICTARSAPALRSQPPETAFAAVARMEGTCPEYSSIPFRHICSARPEP